MTLLKIKTLKNISLLVTLFFTAIINAQKNKIDGVAVVVGKNIVLNSDIEKLKKEFELQSEGKINVSNCEMLEELMNRKLLAHHAIIDSVSVPQGEIDNRVNRSIAFFVNEYGSEEKAVKAYGFNDLEDLRKELEKVQKENILVEKEQQQVTESVDVTPEEVRVYFNGLKEKKELPEIPAEVELAQLVLNAEPSAEEEQRVITKLNKIRKDILNGSSFSLKAIINSDDPSAASNKGNLGLMTKETPFIKEFKEAVFSLDEGDISEPIKTDFGYHIIKLHKIRGNGREVSHILIQPEISENKLRETKEEIEKIISDIKDGKITFKKAVKKYSEDEETKMNGGLLINPYTGETSFELTRMPPDLFGRISELKEGEISDVFYDETREGEKMYKVIFVRKKTETHQANIIQDYLRMQRFALEKKKEETLKKWSKEKIKETYIKLNGDHKKCTFKKDWKKENKKN